MIVFVLFLEFVFFDFVFVDIDGLLVVGGDFFFMWLFMVYRWGIFFWYSENVFILWWSFDFCLILELVYVYVLV